MSVLCTSTYILVHSMQAGHLKTPVSDRTDKSETILVTSQLPALALVDSTHHYHPCSCICYLAGTPRLHLGSRVPCSDHNDTHLATIAVVAAVIVLAAGHERTTNDVGLDVVARHGCIPKKYLLSHTTVRIRSTPYPISGFLVFIPGPVWLTYF